MKENYLCNSILALIVVIAFVVKASVSLAQTNLYPDSISGFEIDFWLGSNPQPANAFNVSIVSDKVFDGLHAVKYDCMDASKPTDGHATVVLGGTNSSFLSGNIAVPAGEYVFRAKIFIEGTAPSNILVYFAEKSLVITEGKSLTIPLPDVTGGSWQTISMPVTFSSGIPEMKTGIRIRGVDYIGRSGPSTIYIDQIVLFPAGEVTNPDDTIYSPILDTNNSWKINTAYSDEFNHSGIDQAKWNYDVGDWGTWSWEPENVSVKDTVLAIQMKQKTHTRGGNPYYFTSGILQNKKTITYGYFEARIKASDKGQGTCPAFWLYSVGQPTPAEEGGVQYSEIDAIEIFQIPDQVKRLEMNLHTRIVENGVLTWKRPGQGDNELTHNSWDAPWDPRDEFHTYGVWNRLDSIFWFVDGIQRGAKKNYYWHLPMYITVSMGLRTPYEKYVDGVRTVMPFPDTSPEPGFPTEMLCDYVRTWDTPAQLYADKSRYLNTEYSVNSVLDFNCRFFAGNENTVLADDWDGIACKLQEIKPDGTVVNEISLNDKTAIGKVSGISSFKFSLLGLKPSAELPAGNSYVIKPVFKTSQNNGKDVYMEDKSYTIKIVKELNTSNSIFSASKSIIIYPNPASQRLNIRVNETNSFHLSLDLYNSCGAKVYSRVIQTGTNHVIDVSNFRKGLYFLRAGNFKSEKIIIQ
jgi:hypothetical protein